MKRMLNGPGALLALLLAGCAVGPDYHGPPQSEWNAPAKFKGAKGANGAWKSAEPADAKERGEWWRVFKDPALDRLIALALAQNQDLRVAVARLDEARAQNRVAASDFYPQVNFDGSAQRQRTSNTLPFQKASLIGANPFGGGASTGAAGAAGGTAGTGGTAGGAGAGAASGASGATSTSSQSGSTVLNSQPLTTTQNLFRAPVDLDWEVDVFGRVRRGYQASRAARQAMEADTRNISLSVAANVAINYFTLRSLDAELGVLESTVGSRREALRIARERLQAGLTSELDVTRAEAQLAADEAQGQAVERTRNQVENALATLLGQPASDFRQQRRPLSAGATPPRIPAGLPSTLLERRPDVAMAERGLAEANARIGVAVAAFFPTIKITGAAGFESADLDTLFKRESSFWQLGPSISLPIFQGGRNFGNLQAARARYAEAVARYRQQVLVAFREVEDALGDLRTLTAQAAAQDRAVAAEQRAVDLAQQQYQKGAFAFLEVLDAERSLLADQRVQAQLQGQRMQATVQLIKALGGDWK